MFSERVVSKAVSTLSGHYLKLEPSDDVELSLPQPGKHYLLYTHVPFCESLCPYCSFNRFPFAEERAIPYFEHMRSELRMLAERGFSFREAYVGGTPTIMMDELAKTIRLTRDIDCAKSSGANQVTFYPLMVSPVSRASIEATMGYVRQRDEEALYHQVFDSFCGGVDPETARNCGIVFLLLAFVGPGLGAAYLTGPTPLLIGLVGAVVVVLYSHGGTPISYLPLGEFVSGFVTGGLITLAGACMQARTLSSFVLVQALPLVVGIGLIMLSNNGCDLERDLEAGRRTLSCLLDRRRTDLLYRIAIVVWLACPICLLAAQGMPMGALVCIDSFVPSHVAVRPFYHLNFSVLMPVMGGGICHWRQYRWLSKSTRQFVSVGQLCDLMVAEGYGGVTRKAFMFGACACASGKRTP